MKCFIVGAGVCTGILVCLLLIFLIIGEITHLIENRKLSGDILDVLFRGFAVSILGIFVCAFGLAVYLVGCSVLGH